MSRRLTTSGRAWLLPALLAGLLALTAGCPRGGQPTGNGSAVSSNPARDSITVEQDQYYLNDRIKAEYRLADVRPHSQAWIALVPAALDSELSEDNEAAQVAYTHIFEPYQGEVHFTAKERGTFVLRLFPSKSAGTKCVAESAAFRIGQPNDGAPAHPDPPFVTLSGSDLPDEIILRPGMVIAAYWMLEDPLGANAWLGLVPTSCTASDAAANRQAALEVQLLDGKTMAANYFSLTQEGAFRFRLFSAQDETGELVCESEVFTVARYVEPEKPAEPAPES
ncbi:hypothetical protein JW859_11210 [bacterium]|nr:hypothetical protein [bacterium]